MNQEFNTLDLNIFFDESGKGQVRPHLMAGFAIPSKLYDSQSFIELTEEIKKRKIHWTNYNGDSKERNLIWKILLTVAQYKHLTRLNAISYNQSKIEETSKNIKGIFPDIVDQTIFMKFPERIVYGLLRKYGSHMHLNTEIFIEDDSTYHNKKYNLRDQLFQQLNIQSVYRGEHFLIREASYLPKQTEVGIEITDILIGIVRTIIKNEDLTSRSIREKTNLIIRLLSHSDFYSFMSNIRYFEWSSSAELVEISFENYISSFITKHSNF
jgi:hypothetical protein